VIQQWEYKVVAAPVEGLQSRLNTWGRVGWELIGADGTRYILKRPLPLTAGADMLPEEPGSTGSRRRGPRGPRQEDLTGELLTAN